MPLTLFQLIARSELVVHARVSDGDHRLAVVEVIESIHGTAPAPALRLDFRHLNLQRRGEPSVAFGAGEEYLLFLVRPEWRKPKEKSRDIFALFHGRRGRILLPAEGIGTPIEAVRGLASLVGRPPEEQIAGLRGLAGDDNPVLRRAALEEIDRLRAATPDDLTLLVRLLRDPDPETRAACLGLIRAVMGISGDEMVEEAKRAALEAGRAIARNDPVEAVRAEAVRLLGAWPVREDVLGDLRAIAAGDASQVVRYEAHRVLYAWGITGAGRNR